ncbi:hypothetical protein HPB47_012048 [Ixodes persulcatus]|uniref:Uncharacterized protein n=1 Tax=Ixodes persulcatus TaxID=34615 RepID=A0AC60NUQ3_IXOPE|nr:hypothetical protein HPB47_012048 [Ixodes persulcatus]
MAEVGHPAGQGSPSIEMELDRQAERPSLGTSSASSTVSYYESISDELDTNSAPFQLVQNRKRRKVSTSSESSDKTVKTMNRTDPHLTVIVRPKDPDKVIATINPKKIQEKLDMTAPDGVILVRPNRRLNTGSLSWPTNRFHENRRPGSNFNWQYALLHLLSPSDDWVNPRPSSSSLARTLYQRNCDAVAAGVGPHDRTKCEAEDPLCMNCTKAHDSTSRLCPAYKREQKIYRYKSEAKIRCPLAMPGQQPTKQDTTSQLTIFVLNEIPHQRSYPAQHPPPSPHWLRRHVPNDARTWPHLQSARWL